MRYFLQVIIYSLFFILFFISPVFANNVQISNVTLDERRVYGSTILAVVKFDISWDNSWRNTTNYDAVWLVFKVQVNSGTLWNHANAYTDSTYGVKSSTGSNNDLEFAGGGSGVTGVFIQRRSTGTGTVTSKDVKVTIASTTTTATDTISVKVIGIEMVYIPQAPFYAGDGGSGTTGSLVKTTTTYDPWYIESENAIRSTASSTGSFFYRTGGSGGEFTAGSIFTIPAEFPKGYAAFYCMKYEVTEGQYVDFVNSLATAYQTNRDITSGNGTTTGKNSDSAVDRNTVSITGGTATTTRTDRAMGWMNWPDLLAYLDWVGLRPMSELEYEKIARGDVAAVIGEYAWGSSTSITAGVTFSGSPEDGTETFTTASANVIYNSTTFSQGDDFLGSEHVFGPARVGIYATSSSTRSTSGAGYYGVMELSGNVFERVVTIGNTSGLSFWGVNGDGTLISVSSYEGNAQQLGWPGTAMITGNRGVAAAIGGGFHGGAYSSVATILRVSDRSQAALNNANRSNASAVNSFGGRGVRSLSPPTMPTCGNDTTEVPEQCDGTDTTACVAAGGASCTAQCECISGG